MLIGSAVALAAQSITTLHILTHEFIQSFGLLSLFALCGLSGWAYRRLPESPGRADQALWESLAASLWMTFAAFVVMTAANAFVHDCDAADASQIYWVTVLPMAVLGSVLGVVTARRGWGVGRQILMLMALAGASGLHDGFQYLNGVRIVDLLVGDPMAFNQRADMDLVPLHLMQRAWLLWTAAAIWAVSLRVRRPRVAAVVLGGWLLATLGLGSHIGVGWGRSAVLGVLNAELETEHFLIRYPAKGPASVHVQAISRRAEWHYHQIGTDWNLADGRQVEIRLYDNDAQLERVSGIAAAHAGAWQIDLTQVSARSTTLHHELIHARHIELSLNPWLLTSRGNLEGTAVAFTENYTTVAEAHDQQAGALRSDTLPAATDFMSLEGFSKVNEGNAYRSAGSFIGFLVLEHGQDAFVALQESWDFEGTYGASLAQLDEDWRAFLMDVPIDMRTQNKARQSFDPQSRPSYMAKRCPKLGSRKESRTDKAKRLWRMHDAKGAAALWQAQWEKTQDVKWARFVVMALNTLEEYDAALEVVDAGLALPDLEDDQRFDLLDHKVQILVATHEWEALYDAMDARQALDTGVDIRRHHLRHLLEDVSLRDDITDYVVNGREVLGRDYMDRLVLDHPDSVSLRWYAAYTNSWFPKGDFGYFTATEVNQIDRALQILKVTEGLCDQRGKGLLQVIDRALDAEELGLAQRVAQAVADDCDDPVVAHEAQARLQRLAWMNP